MPIEVVCHREGYLDARMSFAAAPADNVELEAGTRPWRPSRSVGEVVAYFAGQFALGAFPPAWLGVMAAGAAAAGAEAEKRPDLGYAYRALPDIILIPATFRSESSRETFFVTLRSKLEANANMRLVDIDQHCRFWPCTSADVSCPDPVCQRQRVLVEEQLKTQLDQIPALRAQTRVVTP